MPNKQDEWLAGIGVDVDTFSTAFKATDDLELSTPTSAAVASAAGENDAEVVSASTNNAPLETGTTDRPAIAVKASGTTFTVTGSGFLPNSSVSVRTTQILPGQVVDLRTPTRSDANGAIAIGISGPTVCAVVGPIFFSATDGREDRSDLTGVLFSNAVEMSCLPLSPNPPDDPDDPPDQPDPAPADPETSE